MRGYIQVMCKCRGMDYEQAQQLVRKSKLADLYMSLTPNEMEVYCEALTDSQYASFCLAYTKA